MSRHVILAGLLVVAATAAPPEAARLAFEGGAELKRQGNLTGAVEALTRAVTLAPDYGEAWWHLAWAEHGLGRTDSAATAWAKAARWLPADDPRAAQARARSTTVTVAAPAPEPAPEPLHRFALPRPYPSTTPWSIRLATTLTGWPLTLAGCLLIALVAWAAAALLADWRTGPGSAQARFVALCAAALRQRATALPLLLRLADDPDLRLLPDADLAAPLRYLAEHRPDVQARLAEVARSGQGRRQRLAALALTSPPERAR